MTNNSPSLLPISVIVPTYNDGDYLRNSVLSIVDQTRPPEKLVVVDDGSQPNTASQIVEEIKIKNFATEIIYVYKENGGPSSARNVGLEYVDTPFVAFLDSDDRMLPGSLGTMLKALEKLPSDYFGVYGTHIDKSTQKHYPYGDFDGSVPPALVGRKHGVAGGVHTYLFKTRCLNEVGNFDESLVNNEDFDLIIRLLLRGWKCRGKVVSVFERNYRENSISRPADPYKAYVEVNKFLLKAEKYNYFTAKELQSRVRGVKFTLAKNYYRNGDILKAKEILNEGVVFFPGNIREIKFLALYFLLSAKFFIKNK